MGYFSVKVVCKKHGKPMEDVTVVMFYHGTFLPGGFSESRTGSDGWAKIYVDGEGTGSLWVQGREVGDFTVRNGKTISVTARCD